MFNEREWYPVWVPARDDDGATMAELPEDDWEFVKRAYNDFVRAQALIREAIERSDVPLDA